MSTTITVGVVDQVLTLIGTPVVSSGGKNEDFVAFNFDEVWNGFSKIAVFYRQTKDIYYALINDQNVATVPPEVIATSGIMYLGVVGVNADNTVTKTSQVLPYRIVGGALDGFKPADPSPDIYEEMLAIITEMRDLAKEIEQKEIDFESDINEQMQAFTTQITQDQESFKDSVNTKVTDFTTTMTEEFDEVKADMNDILKVCNWSIDDLTVYGRTLQNLIDDSNVWKTEQTLQTDSETNVSLLYMSSTNFPHVELRPNTTYTALLDFDFKENSLTNYYINLNVSTASGEKGLLSFLKTDIDNNIKIKKFTTPQDYKSLGTFFVGGSKGSAKFKLNSFMILEGDWTNRDIGFVPFGLNGIQVSEIGVRGKNFYDEKTGIKYGYYSDGTGDYISSNKSFCCTELIPILPNERYIVSSNLNLYSAWKCDINKKPIKRVGSALFNSENAHYIYVNLRLPSQNIEDFERLQVEIADVATEYEPYTGGTVQLAEPVTLHGIPVSSGGNVTIDSQQYISDTIEIQDGVIGVYRRNKEVIFDGSEDEQWNTYSPLSGTTVNTIAFTIGVDDIKVYEDTSIINFKVDKFNGIPQNQMYNTDEEGVSRSTSNLRLRILRSKLETQDLTGFKKCLQSNSIKVIYQLATPTFEPLNQLNQAEIKALTVKSMYHELFTNEPAKTEATWKVFVQGAQNADEKTNVSVDYYVNVTSGSDENEGSQASPFKTIQRAIEALKPSICGICNIYLYNGTYSGFEMANIEYDGSEHLKSAAINIKAVDGQDAVQINTDTMIDIEIPLLRNVSFDKITFLAAKDGSGGIRLWKGHFIFRNCNFHEYLTLNNASVSFESCVFNEDMSFAVTSDQVVQINKVRFYQCSGTLYLLAGKGTLLLDYNENNTINFLGDPLGTESKCYADIIQVMAGENWQPNQ